MYSLQKLWNALLGHSSATIVVVDDSREIRDVVDELLTSLGPTERARLEPIQALVDRVAARSDEQRLIDWIRREVPETQLGDAHEVQAVRTLRNRVAGLGLRDATVLVRKARGA